MLDMESKTKEEEWRDIKGYEGFYQVSNIGRVKGLAHVTIRKDGKRLPIKERFLKPRPNQKGYLQVYLQGGGYKGKNFYVHRLVCEAFHENPENKPYVNHIDENKTNNTARNLEWCTATENNNHGTRNVRAGKAIAKANSKPVGQYTIDGKLIKVWQSAREVERLLWFDHRGISKVALGKQKTAYGYVWKYIDEGKLQ